MHMENFRNYAIAAIAACSIAISGNSHKILTGNRDTKVFSSQHKDTLSTEQFIKQLSVASAKEINLSKLAKKRSMYPKIKEYAVKVMDANILLYADLKPFAEVRNVSLVDSITYVPDQLISTLKKSGKSNFDKKYLSISIEDHNQTIVLLERGALFGDTAIVSFANKQLTVFRRNLEEAKYLSKTLSDHKMTADRPQKKG